jgi:hypothetical protein
MHSTYSFTSSVGVTRSATNQIAATDLVGPDKIFDSCTDERIFVFEASDYDKRLLLDCETARKLVLSLGTLSHMLRVAVAAAPD